MNFEKYIFDWAYLWKLIDRLSNINSLIMQCSFANYFYSCFEIIDFIWYLYHNGFSPSQSKFCQYLNYFYIHIISLCLDYIQKVRMFCFESEIAFWLYLQILFKFHNKYFFNLLYFLRNQFLEYIFQTY